MLIRMLVLPLIISLFLRLVLIFSNSSPSLSMTVSTRSPAVFRVNSRTPQSASHAQSLTETPHPYLSHALAVLIVPALAPTEPLTPHIRVARLFVATDVAPVGVEPAPEALRVAGQQTQTKWKKRRKLTPMHFLYLSSQGLQSAPGMDRPVAVVISPVEGREAALVVPVVAVAVVGEARAMARPVVRRVGSFMVIVVGEVVSE
jgi:hypothetical protein